MSIALRPLCNYMTLIFQDISVCPTTSQTLSFILHWKSETWEACSQKTLRIEFQDHPPYSDHIIHTQWTLCSLVEFTLANLDGLMIAFTGQDTSGSQFLINFYLKEHSVIQSRINLHLAITYSWCCRQNSSLSWGSS